MLRRFLASERAGVAVVVALALPVLIGGLGLGAETGYWRVLQQRLQHAADLGAQGAAARLRAGGEGAALDAAARHLVDRAGAADAALAPVGPPATGALAGNADAVEVALTRVRARLFSALFIEEPVTLRARAVARLVDAGRACVLALSPTAPGAITTGGSAAVRLNGCDIASNSNAGNAFDMQGGAVRVEAGCVSTVGEADVTGGLTLDCGAVREFAPPVGDPYADLEEPAFEGPCASVEEGGGGPATLTATHEHSSGTLSARLCSGLKVKGDLALSPGLYLVEGDLDIGANGSLSGDGVTLFVRDGIKMVGTPALDLSAPTEEPYAGVLAFGPRARTDPQTTLEIRGDVGSSLDGALYFPAATVDLSGNAGTDGCLQIVADRVTFTGSSGFEIRCDVAPGREIVSLRRIELVE